MKTNKKIFIICTALSVASLSYANKEVYCNDQTSADNSAVFTCAMDESKKVPNASSETVAIRCGTEKDYHTPSAVHVKCSSSHLSCDTPKDHDETTQYRFSCENNGGNDYHMYVKSISCDPSQYGTLTAGDTIDTVTGCHG